MSNLFQRIRSKPISVTLVLLAILAAVPLVYGIPVLGLGLEDEGLVRHFDEDESGLYHAWIQSYTEGPLYAPEFDPFLSYPKFFYNTAGIFLYPYSNLVGEDVGAVIKTWRSLNIVFGIGAIFVLFSLARRVFHSNWTAFIASGLLALTPQFISWTTNSRPNPLEWLLILTSLLVLIRMCERFSFKLFLLATLAGALAFATKFGAAPLLILVPIVSIYLIGKQRTDHDRLSEIILEQVRFYRFILPVLAAVMVVGALGILLSLRANGWDGVSLAYGWTEAGMPAEKLPRLLEVLKSAGTLVRLGVWASIVGLALGAVLTMLVWARMQALASIEILQLNISSYVIILAGLAILTAVVYLVVFFATGPAFIAHPEHFFSEIGFEFRYILLGGSYGGSQDPQLPGYIEFFKMVGRQFHLGWLAFAPILGYTVFVNTRGSNNSSVQRDQRLVLWGFILLSLAVYLGLKSAPSLRHIMPAIAIIFALLAEVVVRQFSNWRTSYTAGAMAIALVVLLAIGVGTNARNVYGSWDHLRSKPQDTGIQVGKWLQEEYPKDTRLMTDYIRFYVPPSFTEVANTTTAEWDRFRGPDVNQAVIDYIVSFDPEVLVLSHPQKYENFVNVFPLLESNEMLRSRNYKLVKEFEYQRPDRQRYQYKHILVYEKGEFAAGTSLDNKSPVLR